MNKARKYFDHRGNEADERTALDRNGTLKNGFSMRISLAARDAALGLNGAGSNGARDPVVGSACTRNGWPGTLQIDADGELFCDIGKADSASRITDGRTFDAMALHRPGFQSPGRQ